MSYTIQALTSNSQLHHWRDVGCEQLYTVISVAILSSTHRELVDARWPIHLIRRSVATSEEDAVFTKAQRSPRVHSISAGDGEAGSFHSSDSSHRVDGDRLGHWNAQHT